MKISTLEKAYIYVVQKKEINTYYLFTDSKIFGVASPKERYNEEGKKIYNSDPVEMLLCSLIISRHLTDEQKKEGNPGKYSEKWNKEDEETLLKLFPICDIKNQKESVMHMNFEKYHKLTKQERLELI
jgi:hypothetical protein